jgi:hypothetical protein
VVNERVILARIQQIQDEMDHLEREPDLLVEGETTTYKEAQLHRLGQQLSRTCELLEAVGATGHACDIDSKSPVCV